MNSQNQWAPNKTTIFWYILVWDTMAEKFASSGLKVGKMDSTVNEIEGMVNINSFPTIRLYKQDGTQVDIYLVKRYSVELINRMCTLHDKTLYGASFEWYISFEGSIYFIYWIYASRLILSNWWENNILLVRKRKTSCF